MATPPTLVADYQSTWDAGTGQKDVSTTVGNGDILVVAAAVEDTSFTLATTGAGGLTYTLRQQVTTASNCGVYGWTAPSTSAQTFTQTITKSGGTADYGYDTFRFSGSDGVGASAKTNASGAPSLSITTTQDNSAIVVIVADWNAVSGSSRTWRTVNGITPVATPGNGYERNYFLDGSAYTTYLAYYPDAGTAGAKTVGLSAPSGQKYAIIAIEIKGTAGGSDVTGSDAPSGMREGISAETVTSNVVTSDSSLGVRLGSSAVTSSAGVTSTDSPSGIRLGNSADSTSIQLLATDTPGGVRLGISTETSVVNILVQDSPSSISLGQSLELVTNDLILSDFPEGMRLGGSAEDSSFLTPLVLEDTSVGIRLGESEETLSYELFLSDASVGIRLGNSPVDTTFGAFDVAASDGSVGIRLGSSSVSAVVSGPLATSPTLFVTVGKSLSVTVSRPTLKVSVGTSLRSIVRTP
jgi:hypothetical protein